MSHINGKDDLMKQFKQIAGCDKVMEKSIRKWTEYVRGEAVDLCPVDTGELQQSIHSDVTAGKEIVGIIYTNKEYAPYVEFGTGKRGAASSGTSPEIKVSYSHTINGQPAQPFLYPALNNNKARIMKGIRDDMRKAIGDAK